MRRSLVAIALTAGVAGALATAGAASASADTAPTGTPVSFTVTGGALNISQPTGTVSLGTAGVALSGTTVTGSLGNTTVTDLRAVTLAGSWTVSVTGPAAFTDANGDTVATSNASVWIPSVTVSPLVTSAVPANLYSTQLTALPLTTGSQTLLTAVTTGTNSAVFAPSIAVKIPSTTLAGTYTGTVTETVS